MLYRSFKNYITCEKIKCMRLKVNASQEQEILIFMAMKKLHFRSYVNEN
jgi:hypothetical protein